MQIFDNTLTLMERALDVRLRKQVVLNSNAANVDTPEYSPQDVDFDAAIAAHDARVGIDTGKLPLQPAGGESSALPLQSNQTVPANFVSEADMPDREVISVEDDIPVLKSLDKSVGMDGNGVDLDRTMAALSENALQYTAVSKAAGKKLGILRYAISET